jgi:uncharacterized damage-inducible protein DinB
MPADDLFSLYAFNRWADDRMLGAVRQLTPEQYVQEPAPGWSSVRATLVHLGDATWIWARRLRGEPVSGRAAETDVPTIDDAAKLLAQGQDAFDALLQGLTPERLAGLWSYHDLSGKDRRTPLWAVYRHVVNHATYHRGQIASKLKRFGVEQPATDLVFWAFEQSPQP